MWCKLAALSAAAVLRQCVAIVLPKTDLTQTVEDAICIDGKAVPQLYLLGCQKCGTSVVAKELTASGVQIAGNADWKELHAVDKTFCSWKPEVNRTHDDWSGSAKITECDGQNQALVKSWANEFDNDCSFQGQVLTDMTPVYIRLPGLPSALSHIYGGEAHRVVFAIILREPVGRLHAGHYQTKKHLISDELLAASPNGQSFSEYVNYLKKNVPLYEGKGWWGMEQDYGMDQFYRSMYSLALRSWLDSFPAQQFVVVPMVGHLAGDLKTRQDTMDLIFGKLDMTPTPLRKLQTTTNPDYHPPLEEDISPADLAWLKRYYEEDTKQLAKLLAASIPKGLALKGYVGDPTPESIEDYLVLNW